MSIQKSIENKPLQWLGVVVGLGAAGYLLMRRIVPTKDERLQDRAEQSVSVNNPFSYTMFLSQTIPAGTPLYTIAGAQALAKKIYDALNTYFDDDEDIVFGVFKSMSNKVKVAQVAQEFYKLYKRDILEYLKNGKKTFSFGTSGLSDSDYSKVLTIVDNKPKF